MDTAYERRIVTTTYRRLMGNADSKSTHLLALFSLSAFAGTSATLTINYSPAVGATPTLTQSMLIALALLLPVVAFRALRQLRPNSSVTALLLAVGLAVISPLKVLKAINVNLNLTSASGGTLSQTIPAGTTFTVTNTSGTTLVIRTLTLVIPPSTNVTPDVVGGACQVGTTLAPNASCTVRFTAPPAG